MFNMMNTIGGAPGLGFGFLWILHIASVIAFFTGLVFLIVLAIRTFKPEQLKSWAIWLMVGGAVVCLFTIGMTGRSWAGSGMYGPMSGNNGMLWMMSTLDSDARDQMMNQWQQEWGNSQ